MISCNLIFAKEKKTPKSDFDPKLADYELRGKTIMGFNSNPILAQFVPFNRVGQTFSEPSIMIRQYFGKYGYRFGIGIFNDPISLENQSVNINLGYSKRLHLDKKFFYFTGMELKAHFKNGFAVNNVIPNDFFGISRYWGVEYQFNRVFSISTEMNLRVGFFGDSEDVRLALNPPMSFLCHFRFN